MKKSVLFSLFLLIAAASFAQSSQSSDAPYKKDPHLPHFNIVLPDSSWYTPEQLPKKGYDYTILVYFSPDCSHCQHEAKEIVGKMDSLKNAFFVFVAYKPLDEIAAFASYYGLDKFPNVKLGRDPQYFVPSFFRVTRTPFIVVYDKKQMLYKVYDPEVTNVPDASELAKLVNGQ
jgi:thiol-disulfide isomerase/thioredoxin